MKAPGYRRRYFDRAVPFIGFALLMLACGPASTASGPTAVGQPAVPAGPKVLRIGEETEYPYLIQYGRVPSTDPNPERYYMFHDNLVVFDREGNPVPRMAQKVPTVQDGDWKVNPDGTMEVTWKVRPDTLWQDGTPVTADDWVFGYEVAMDPKLVIPGGTESLKSIASVKAVDPKTLLVSWKVPYIYGNANNYDAIPLIAKHQVEPLYRTLDAAAFEASQIWRSEFLGAGPFRVTEIAPSDHITGIAFDKFYLGRPKIDRIEIYWMPIDVMVARVLADSIDLLDAGSHAKPNQLIDIRQQKGPNWGIAFNKYAQIRTLKLNFRENGPWVKDLRFRQALAYSLDRQAFVEGIGGDVTAVTSYALAADDPVYKLAEQRGIPKYGYEPTRAQQLFAEAGWIKGADGLLRNSAGETVPFPCCRYANAGSENVRESLIWADGLKKVGIDAHHPIPALPAGLAATENRKAGNFGWAGQTSNWFLVVSQHFATLTSVLIPDDANRWTGSNNGAYSNPAFDKLLAERMATIPIGDRREKEVQLVKIMAEELPNIPTYYNPAVIIAREGVTGVSMFAVLNAAITMDIYTWDIK